MLQPSLTLKMKEKLSQQIKKMDNLAQNILLSNDTPSFDSSMTILQMLSDEQLSMIKEKFQKMRGNKAKALSQVCKQLISKRHGNLPKQSKQKNENNLKKQNSFRIKPKISIIDSVLNQTKASKIQPQKSKITNSDQNNRQQYILYQQSIAQISQLLYPENICFIFIGQFQETTCNLYKSISRQIKLNNHYDISKIQNQIIDLASKHSIYLISKYMLDQQIQQNILKSVKSIFYCQIEKQVPDTLTRVFYKSQDQLRSVGLVQFKKQANQDVTTKQMPNFSCVSGDKTKINFCRFNMIWMIKTNILDKTKQLFSKLIQYRYSLHPQSGYIQDIMKIQESLKYNLLQKDFRCISAYTQETLFFRIINRGLRSLRYPKHIPYIHYPTYLLYHQLKQLFMHQLKQHNFREQSYLYRGCRLTQSQLKIMKNSKQKYIQLQGFLSTSRIETKAKQFGEHLLKIKIPDQKKLEFILSSNDISGYFADIGQFSYEIQQQVLFTPLNYFKVVQVRQVQNFIQIQLQLTVIQILKQQNVVEVRQKQLLLNYEYTQKRSKQINNQGGLFYSLGFYQSQFEYLLKQIQTINQKILQKQSLSFSIYQCLKAWVQNPQQTIAPSVQYLKLMLSQSPFNFADSKKMIMFVLQEELVQQIKNNTITNTLIISYLNCLLQKAKIQEINQIIQVWIKIHNHLKLYPLSDNQQLNTILEQALSQILQQLQNWIFKHRLFYSNQKNNTIVEQPNMFQNQQKIKHQLISMYQEQGNYGPNSILVLLYIHRQIQQCLCNHNYIKLKQLYEQFQHKISSWLKNQLFKPYILMIHRYLFELSAQMGTIDENQQYLRKFQRQISTRTDPAEAIDKLAVVGQMYDRLGLYRKQKYIYEKALILQNSKIQNNKKIKGQILLKLGHINRQLGNYTQSKQKLLQASYLFQHVYGINSSELIRVNHEIAIILYEQGQYKRAQQLYESSLNLIQTHQLQDQKKRIAILNHLGMIKKKCGKIQEALIFYEKALLIQKQKFKQQNAQGFILNYNIGNAYLIKKDYQLANEFYEKAQKIIIIFYKQDHPKYGQFLINLGQLREATGHNQQALQIYNHAMNILSRYYGQSNIILLSALINIGALNFKQGNYHCSIQLMKKAFQVCNQNYSGQHIETAFLLNNMGTLYRNLGEYSKAQECITKSIKIYKQNGDQIYQQHLSSALVNMGNLQNIHGNYQKALVYYQQAQALLNENNCGQSNSLKSNLAVLYKNIGNYAKSKQILQQIYKIELQLYGKNSPEVMNDIHNLAILHDEMGQQEQSYKYYRQCVQLKQQYYGADNIETGLAYNNIASFQIKINELQQARLSLVKAVPIIQQFYGSNSIIFGKVQNNVALFFMNTGQYQKSLKVFEQILQINQNLYPKNSVNNISVLINLANLKIKLALFQQAKTLFLQAYQIAKNSYNQAHSNTASILNNLGTLNYILQEYNKAIQCFEECHKMRIILYGQDHIQTLNILQRLAFVHEKIGNFEQSVNIIENILSKVKKLDLNYRIYNLLQQIYKISVSFTKQKVNSNKLLSIYLIISSQIQKYPHPSPQILSTLLQQINMLKEVPKIS